MQESQTNKVSRPPSAECGDGYHAACPYNSQMCGCSCHRGGLAPMPPTPRVSNICKEGDHHKCGKCDCPCHRAHEGIGHLDKAWQSDPLRNPDNDHWAHRSILMRCSTCMWWVEKKGGEAHLGRCRKHAPTLSGWPAVFSDDWCGDHKLDENKAQS